MPLNPDAVGSTSDPVDVSWTSKDALLYALGVGAGVDELAFTTENTRDTPQRVLPTMAVVIGMGGLPFDKIGSFNPAMLLHGAQKIELFAEIPVEGEIESSGRIGSCFSRIVAEQVDALICVPVLKDHSLAGVSLGMKNYYGAIHNPNKYHDDHCDPFIVDVVSHRFIRSKWRLTVCDATRAQCHAGQDPLHVADQP